MHGCVHTKSTMHPQCMHLQFVTALFTLISWEAGSLTNYPGFNFSSVLVDHHTLGHKFIISLVDGDTGTKFNSMFIEWVKMILEHFHWFMMMDDGK